MVKATVQRRLFMRCPTEKCLEPIDFGKFTCRSLEPSDWIPLGQLLFRSFEGGVDDRGDTEESWLRYAGRTLRGRLGNVLWDASLALLDEDVLVCAGAVVYQSDAGYLSVMVTDPAFRNLKLGERMLRKSLHKLYESNLKYMTLHVTQENIAAMHLYKKLGFEFIYDYYQLKVDFPRRRVK